MNSLFERGWLTLFHWKGIPVRAHWTLPIGAVFMTGFAFVPGAWLGFVLLVLVHELGHAILVRGYGLDVESIDVHGFGGMCRWSGNATARTRSVIAWGGVIAQAFLLGATVLVSRLSPPTTPFWLQVVGVFTTTNLILMGLNLLPFHPLDGAEAWKLFRFKPLPKPRPRRDETLRARARAIEEELERMREAEQAADDDAPPMPPEVQKLLDEILERERNSKKPTLN